MTNKNPYENETQELDIPDFVEDKTRGDSSTSIDMSIFKMSEDDLYDDEDNYDDDDDLFDERPRKRKANTPIVICLIITILLLLTSVAAVFYALKMRQEYIKANTAYLQVLANEEAYKSQLAQKDSQIDALNQQIDQLKKANNKGEGSIEYVVTDGPITFRVGPSREVDSTTYKNEEYAYNGEHYFVIEVVKGTDDPDYEWGKIADRVYFCLGSAGEPYAEKVQ